MLTDRMNLKNKNPETNEFGLGTFLRLCPQPYDEGEGQYEVIVLHPSPIQDEELKGWVHWKDTV